MLQNWFTGPWAVTWSQTVTLVLDLKMRSVSSSGTPYW